ncbi:hypothetical protein PRIPAC_96579 [Pristionchus pacificus]|uniref:Serpentine receptor class gamma n=1 Tax=Pristionchus pacificus TaxID=54126 RepID=A0A2A6D2K9_PRIPA|nr:hypothetical protein PRIPAC_96579 [Pristionchus pacificus]|eukprot:PDM84547.1 G protein-coupled receptor [Pristionchus pacificus]
MISSDLAVIGYAVYILPLIVLYILELIVIVNYRKQTFSSSFFKIFAVLAVVNVSSCVLGSFVFRLNLYSIVNGFYANLMSTSTWLTVAYVYVFVFMKYGYGSYYLNCLSESLGALLAFNRFTALFFPLQHDQACMWHWRMLSACVLLCCLISIAPIWFLLDNTTTFVQYTEYGTDFYVVRAISPTLQGSIWFNMAMVTLCCTGLSTVMYLACAVRLCTSLGTRNRTAELNLFLAGFFAMLCSLPHMIAMARQAYLEKSTFAFIGVVLLESDHWTREWHVRP